MASDGSVSSPRLQQSISQARRLCVANYISGKSPVDAAMGRIRVRRMPEGTFELLLNLTNRHVHAQLVDRHAGRVILGVHSNEPVRTSPLLSV